MSVFASVCSVQSLFLFSVFMVCDVSVSCSVIGGHHLHSHAASLEPLSVGDEHVLEVCHIREIGSEADGSRQALHIVWPPTASRF